MKLDSLIIKEENCIMSGKYYLTYLKKERIAGKWTIDFSTKLYLDKNGNQVNRGNSVLEINPFYQAYKTDKKTQFKVLSMGPTELLILIVVNEVIKPNNILID